MTVDSFWDWSLGKYRCEATQQCLLALQEEADLVILEALFACWLATQRVHWQSGDVAAMREATGVWIEEVILPLRSTRERWKPDAEKQSQRQQILRLEVDAERYLAELMWANTDTVGDIGHDTVQRNELATVELMNANLSALPVFNKGEFVSERQQLVALLIQST